MIQKPPPLEPRFRFALRTVQPAPEGTRERVRSRLIAAVPLVGVGRAGADAVHGSSAASVAHGAGGPAAAVATNAPAATSGAGVAGATGGAGASGLGASGLGAAAARGAMSFGAAKIAAAALVLGAASSAGVLAALEAHKAPTIVYVDRSASNVEPASFSPAIAAPAAPTEGSRLATTASAAIAEASRPAVAPGSEMATASAAAGASAQVRGAASARSSTFTAERLLLDHARAALVQGDPDRALALLDRHRARFGGGVFAQEREAMRVEALVGAQRYDEARAAARSFRAHSPGSLFLPAVESAVASIP